LPTFGTARVFELPDDVKAGLDRIFADVEAHRPAV